MEIISVVYRNGARIVQVALEHGRVIEVTVPFMGLEPETDDWYWSRDWISEVRTGPSTGT